MERNDPVPEAPVSDPSVPVERASVAALVSGILAIHGLLRFLRSHPTHVFVAYRVLLAAVIVVIWLSPGR